MGWVRFSLVRMVVFAMLFVSSAAVIGILSYLASLFVNQKYDRPWIIFGLIVAIVSLLASAVLAFMYSFSTHIGCIGLLCVLWLGMAAYTTDRIGYVQCEALDGERRPLDRGGSYNSVTYCRLVKAVMGFAWFNFGATLIAVVSWIRLQEDEERRGFTDEVDSESGSLRRQARAGELANRYSRRGYPVVANGGYVQQGVPGQYMTGGTMLPNGTGGAVVQQLPGHNIVVQGNQIRQVPVGQQIY